MEVLSSYNQVHRNHQDFSFTDKVSKLAINNKWRNGYQDFSDDIQNSKSYFWYVLSAIGQDLGDIVYRNIYDYIDNISNIDKCTIKALKSISNEYGLDNQILNLNDIPLELENLLDIFSINKSYLLSKNSVISDNTKQLLLDNTKYDFSQYEQNFSDSDYTNGDIVLDTQNVKTSVKGEFGLFIDGQQNGKYEKLYIKEGKLTLEYTDQVYNQEYIDAISSVSDIYEYVDQLSVVIERSGEQTDQVQFNKIYKGKTTGYNLYYIKFTPTLSSTIVNYPLYKYEEPVYFWVILNGDNSKMIASTYSTIDTSNSTNSFFVPVDIDNKQFCYNGIRVKDNDNTVTDVMLNSSIYMFHISYKDGEWTYALNKRDEINIYNISVNKIDSEFSPYQKISRDISTTIDEQKYKDIVQQCIRSLLVDMCSLQYLDSTTSERTIFKTSKFRNNLDIKSLMINDRTSDDDIIEMKNEYGVPLKFNEREEVDKIDSGLKSLTDYSVKEQKILDLEIQRRAKAYVPYKNITRYYYYREAKVKQYFKFIQQMYYGSEINGKDYFVTHYSDDGNEYVEVDKNYFSVNDIDTPESLCYTDSDGNVVLNDNMLDKVSYILMKICFSIQKIRDNLKTMAQKYHMRGTYELLAYTINEYILNNIKAQYQEFDSMSTTGQSDIDIVEYVDNTEYFNIKQNLEKYTNIKYSDTQNNRYFENTLFEELYLKNNPNDVFKRSLSLGYDEISTYYNVVQNMDIGNDDQLQDFLDAVYNSGATFSHINADTNDIEHANKAEVTGIKIDDKLDHMTSQYKKYSGNETGDDVVYNFKNKAFSSYQIHPFMYNFVEYLDQVFPIENYYHKYIPEDYYQQVVDKIDEYVGIYGQIRNIWKYDTFDYTGYSSRFEIENNNSQKNSNKISRYVNRDGMFFEEFVNAYFGYISQEYSNYDKSTEDMNDTLSYSSYLEDYYSHLNISEYEIELDKRRFIKYQSIIQDIVYDNPQYYDIYKYTVDINGNVLFLLKRYDTQVSDTDIQTKKNTRGTLWVRIKDHPVAFPAFNINVDQFKLNKKLQHCTIDTSQKLENQKYVMNEDDSAFYNLDIDMVNHEIFTDFSGGFYDMELDQTLQYMALSYTPESIINYTDVHSYKNVDVMVGKLSKEYDYSRCLFRYSFECDKDNMVEKITSGNLREKIQDYSYNDFIGFIRTDSSFGAMFLKKGYNLTTNSDTLVKTEFSDSVLIEETNEYQQTSNLYSTHLYIKTFDYTNILKTYDITISDLKYNINSDNNICMSQGGEYITVAYESEEVPLYNIVTNYSEFDYNNSIDVLNSQYLSSLYDGTLSDDNDLSIYTKHQLINWPYKSTEQSVHTGVDTNDELHNTFDSFDKYIVTIDCKFDNKKFEYIKSSYFNLNSDMAFNPVYGDEGGTNRLWNNQQLSCNDEINIQLMGYSSDIQDYDAIDDTTQDDQDKSTAVRQLTKIGNYGSVYENPFPYYSSGYISSDITIDMSQIDDDYRTNDMNGKILYSIDTDIPFQYYMMKAQSQTDGVNAQYVKTTDGKYVTICYSSNTDYLINQQVDIKYYIDEYKYSSDPVYYPSVDINDGYQQLQLTDRIYVSSKTGYEGVDTNKDLMLLQEYTKYHPTHIYEDNISVGTQNDILSNFLGKVDFQCSSITQRLYEIESSINSISVQNIWSDSGSNKNQFQLSSNGEFGLFTDNINIDQLEDLITEIPANVSGEFSNEIVLFTATPFGLRNVNNSYIIPTDDNVSSVTVIEKLNQEQTGTLIYSFSNNKGLIRNNVISDDIIRPIYYAQDEMYNKIFDDTNLSDDIKLSTSVICIGNIYGKYQFKDLSSYTKSFGKYANTILSGNNILHIYDYKHNKIQTIRTRYSDGDDYFTSENKIDTDKTIPLFPERMAINNGTIVMSPPVQQDALSGLFVTSVSSIVSALSSNSTNIYDFNLSGYPNIVARHITTYLDESNQSQNFGRISVVKYSNDVSCFVACSYDYTKDLSERYRIFTSLDGMTWKKQNVFNVALDYNLSSQVISGDYGRMSSERWVSRCYIEDIEFVKDKFQNKDVVTCHVLGTMYKQIGMLKYDRDDNTFSSYAQNDFTGINFTPVGDVGTPILSSSPFSCTSVQRKNTQNNSSTKYVYYFGQYDPRCNLNCSRLQVTEIEGYKFVWFNTYMARRINSGKTSNSKGTAYGANKAGLDFYLSYPPYYIVNSDYQNNPGFLGLVYKGSCWWNKSDSGTTATAQQLKIIETQQVFMNRTGIYGIYQIPTLRNITGLLSSDGQYNCVRIYSKESILSLIGAVRESPIQSYWVDLGNNALTSISTYKEFGSTQDLTGQVSSLMIRPRFPSQFIINKNNSSSQWILSRNKYTGEYLYQKNHDDECINIGSDISSYLNASDTNKQTTIVFDPLTISKTDNNISVSNGRNIYTYTDYDDISSCLQYRQITQRSIDILLSNDNNYYYSIDQWNSLSSLRDEISSLLYNRLPYFRQYYLSVSNYNNSYRLVTTPCSNDVSDYFQNFINNVNSKYSINQISGLSSIYVDNQNNLYINANNKLYYAISSDSFYDEFKDMGCVISSLRMYKGTKEYNKDTIFINDISSGYFSSFKYSNSIPGQIQGVQYSTNESYQVFDIDMSVLSGYDYIVGIFNSYTNRLILSYNTQLSSVETNSYPSREQIDNILGRYDINEIYNGSNDPVMQNYQVLIDNIYGFDISASTDKTSVSVYYKLDENGVAYVDTGAFYVLATQIRRNIGDYEKYHIFDMKGQKTSSDIVQIMSSVDYYDDSNEISSNTLFSGDNPEMAFKYPSEQSIGQDNYPIL